MKTKEEAKAAWKTIKTFSIMNSNKQSFSAKDITKIMQDAILTLDVYFTEVDNND